MATTIGRLNVQISASSAGVAETMNAAATTTQNFARKVNESNAVLAQSSLGSKKAGQAFLELSRGVEDAAAVYGTSGLAGALRASSNNISQFAAIINPAAGAVAGLAVAVGSSLIPKLFSTEKEAKSLKVEIDSLQRSFSGLADAMQKASDQRVSIREMANFKSPDDAKNSIREQMNNSDELKSRVDDIINARRSLERQLANPKKMGGWGRQMFGWLSPITGIDNIEDDAKQVARNKALQEEIQKLNDQKRAIEQQIEASGRLTQEAQNRLKVLREQERLQQQEADSQEAMLQRSELDQRIREQTAEAIERTADAAKEIGRILNPKRAALDELQKQYEERRNAIGSDLSLSREERNAALGSNTAALAAQIRQQFSSMNPATSAPAALTRGSAGAFNVGINRNLEKQRQDEIAANTKAMVSKIVEGNKLLKDIATGGAVKIGSF